MSLVDAVIRPQAIFAGVDESDVRLTVMRSQVSGSLVLGSSSAPADVRPLDFDLWIQLGGDIDSVPDHMHVLALGAGRQGMVDTSWGSTSLFYGPGNPSPTMRIASDLPEDVERLIRHDLVPWLQSQDSRPVLAIPQRVPYGPNHKPVASDESGLKVIPFVVDADDHVIAGAFLRSDGENSWLWALPHKPSRPELWLAVALRDWHGRTPDRVPAASPWQQQVSWMTREELRAEKDLVDLERRRKSWESLYVRRREQLEAEQLRARTDAEGGLRRLLVSNDEELVHAVGDALERLGYAVTNEDDRREVGQGKAHDLNVADPDQPASEVIAEVKGFTKGARGALAQAQQHILRYAVTHGGRTPDKSWLVVNHFRGRDPSERPLLLQGADEDIAVFESSGGVLIDTRDLFLLVRLVEAGEITAAEARSCFRTASGRFVLPSPNERGEAEDGAPAPPAGTAPAKPAP